MTVFQFSESCSINRDVLTICVIMGKILSRISLIIMTIASYGASSLLMFMGSLFI